MSNDEKEEDIILFKPVLVERNDKKCPLIEYKKNDTYIENPADPDIDSDKYTDAEIKRSDEYNDTDTDIEDDDKEAGAEAEIGTDITENIYDETGYVYKCENPAVVCKKPTTHFYSLRNAPVSGSWRKN